MSAFYFTENTRDQIGRTTSTIFDNIPERKYIDERWSRQTRAIAYEVQNNCQRMTLYEQREFIRKTYKIPCETENEIMFYCYCVWNGKLNYLDVALGIEGKTVASFMNNDATVVPKSPAAVKIKRKNTAETPKGNIGQKALQVKNDSLFNEFRPKRKYEFRNRKPNKYKAP